MKINTFKYQNRKCCVCGSNDFENLWFYKHETKTRNYYWEFEVNNVICTKCGFTFVSPAPAPEELNNYYSDSLVSYVGQDIDYDVDTRLKVISKYKEKPECFLELGSNQPNKFSKKINKMFAKVISVEPNNAFETDYKTIFDVPSKSINMLANYFVLEHISNINEIFEEFNRVITNEGILICEVPDMRMYPDNIIACHQHEHLNHFSPLKLSEIAITCGFKELKSSVKLCSRGYGFVSVFKLQKDDLLPSYNINEYKINKTLFKAGVSKAMTVLEHFTNASEKIRSLQTCAIPFIVWGANENFLQLIKKIPDFTKICCIDSNSDKKNYLPGIIVNTPNAAEKNILESEFIFICAGRHHVTILDYINFTFGKKYSNEKIYLLDREVS